MDEVEREIFEIREQVVRDFYNYCMDNNDGNISEVAMIKYLEQFVTNPKPNS